MGFGKFANKYLMPEDPMEWVILLTVCFVAIGGITLLVIMAASGYL